MYTMLVKSIINLIMSFLGFSKQIAENKSVKQPMQEPAIRAKAELTKEKKEVRKKRVKRIIPFEQIEAEAKLLGLKRRATKQLVEQCKNIIIKGGEITNIFWVDDNDEKVLPENGVFIKIEYVFRDNDMIHLFR
jgi:hypothetical protein